MEMVGEREHRRTAVLGHARRGRQGGPEGLRLTGQEIDVVHSEPQRAGRPWSVPHPFEGAACEAAADGVGRSGDTSQFVLTRSRRRHFNCV